MRLIEGNQGVSTERNWDYSWIWESLRLHWGDHLFEIEFETQEWTAILLTYLARLWGDHLIANSLLTEFYYAITRFGLDGASFTEFWVSSSCL